MTRFEEFGCNEKLDNQKIQKVNETTAIKLYTHQMKIEFSSGEKNDYFFSLLQKNPKKKRSCLFGGGRADKFIKKKTSLKQKKSALKKQ